MTDQYHMNKTAFDGHLSRLYIHRKPWIYNGVDDAVRRLRWRIQLHWDKRNGLLHTAFYSKRNSANLLLCLQRSKPKHIIKYVPIFAHITMITKRKPWKRANSHTGPLFWRNFW